MSKLKQVRRMARGCAHGLLALAMCAPVAALAQETHSWPDPRNGPSLQVTLQFVTDKVNQQGTVNVAGYVHDNATQKDSLMRESIDQTGVNFDRRSCKLGYHKKVTSNGSTKVDGDVWLSLRTAGQVDVIPMEQAWKRDDSSAGITTLSYKADPPVYVVRINPASSSPYELEFYDERLANRVAEALRHAVYLCGGGREAF